MIIEMSTENRLNEISENESGTDSESRHSENEMESETENDKLTSKEEEEEEEEELEDKNDKSKQNPGWADAMRKVLSNKKPKRKKSIVLSKAKKHCNNELKETKEKISFEIDNANETPIVKETEKETDEKKRIKKTLKSGIRIKPSILDRERERILQKIATKGVLQLFNAVKQQQVDIDKKLVKAGPLERKREKVLKDIDKKAFLDVLMGGTKSIQVDKCANESAEKNETSEKNVWKVLRDDFVMGASLKDWDKKTPIKGNSDSDE